MCWHRSWPPALPPARSPARKNAKHTKCLLASPLRPAAIVLGKLLASLAHLAILIFSSLPIVMLCLPLGGVSLYEVLAAYLALVMSIITFGMISVACSSYFQRTAASLVVSYLLILPLAHDRHSHCGNASRARRRIPLVRRR